MEAGVVNVAVAVRHHHQDIRKTHVPQEFVRGISVTGVDGMGNGLVDPGQRDYNCGFRRSQRFRRGPIDLPVLQSQPPHSHRR